MNRRLTNLPLGSTVCAPIDRASRTAASGSVKSIPNAICGSSLRRRRKVGRWNEITVTSGTTRARWISARTRSSMPGLGRQPRLISRYARHCLVQTQSRVSASVGIFSPA
jgi:hypothetical protein